MQARHIKIYINVAICLQVPITEVATKQIGNQYVVYVAVLNIFLLLYHYKSLVFVWIQMKWARKKRNKWTSSCTFLLLVTY